MNELMSMMVNSIDRVYHIDREYMHHNQVAVNDQKRSSIDGEFN